MDCFAKSQTLNVYKLKHTRFDIMQSWVSRIYVKHNLRHIVWFNRLNIKENNFTLYKSWVLLLYVKHNLGNIMV
jgi:hypothetical protein